MVTKRQLYSILLVVFCLSVASDVKTAHAQVPWTLYQLSSYVVPSTTPGYAEHHITFPTNIVGNTKWMAYNVRFLPKNNNWWAQEDGEQCYPRGGGSSGFDETEIYQLLPTAHTNNTSAGAVACDVSGTYYQMYRDVSSSSTILYVASYQYNAETQTYISLGSAPQLQATTSYQTRIESVDINTEYGLEPESLQYERITGVSNPGRFDTANLTSGIGGSALSGKYITKFAINGRTNGTQSNVLLTVYDTGVPITSVVASITTTDTAVWTDFVLPSPIFVEDGADITIRPTLDSGDAGYPYGEAGGTSSWNLRVYGNAQVVSGVSMTAEYLLNTQEIISTVSEKNPTQVSFELSKQPSTTISKQGESINNTVNGTGTVSTTFTGLVDGTYDLLARFSNTGCALGLSQCPFPLAYVYTTFTVENGEVVSVSPSEVYNNVTPPPSVTQYEDCGLTNIAGCINNSFRFLFIPSETAVDELVNVKEIASGKAPFAYAVDMTTVLSELTQTANAQTLDMTVDLGFGEITIIDQGMIESAPYASTIRQLLVYLLWLSFAFAMYRIALSIHDHDNRTI